MEYRYFDRDLSWLSFNERVLMEAGRQAVPLLERINFLSIYSSNLDEFYRVRIPSLMALQKLKKHRDASTRLLEELSQRINEQQGMFGLRLTQEIIPQLREKQIHFVYNEPIPASVREAAQDYFFSKVLGFLQPVELSAAPGSFFPENNHLYLAAILQDQAEPIHVILNIPSSSLPRFFTASAEGWQYVIFIDDLLKEFITLLYPGTHLISAHSFKITRDAELDLQDEFEGDIAEKIEKQIAKRDQGFATRLLYAPGIPDHLLNLMINAFSLNNASLVQGGSYHHLKDLAGFPLQPANCRYPEWKAAKPVLHSPDSLLESIRQDDILLHTPYQDYSLVVRFFNESAFDPLVEEIYVTMYRIASDSLIAHALISAALNGKSVTVFVELKARFDEANNIRWSKKMKEAGVKIIYSIPGLKVHAKVALVKKRVENRIRYTGLLSTGNFNESTARFYTDHILMTSHKKMLRELELLFLFLAKRKHPAHQKEIEFEHLLVAQFNLQQRFIGMIDREIKVAQQGKPARIVIKLNNLEEEVMINKLYEAAAAGVQIELIVRTICRLQPTENLRVRRIVDRYLEHGRICWFQNNGEDELYAGSADWMNRNIYRRIEVCFPIYEERLKHEIKTLLDIQLADNIQAVTMDEHLINHPVVMSDEPIRSQEAIWKYFHQHE